MANPPISIPPFPNVPAPGSPIKSDWPQQLTTFAVQTDRTIHRDPSGTAGVDLIKVRPNAGNIGRTTVQDSAGFEVNGAAAAGGAVTWALHAGDEPPGGSGRVGIRAGHWDGAAGPGPAALLLTSFTGSGDPKYWLDIGVMTGNCVMRFQKVTSIQATAPWPVPSSADLKQDVADYDGRHDIDAVQVVDYAYTYDPDSPRVGIVAEQLADVIPEAIAVDPIDGHVTGYHVDVVVAVLVQEVQDLRARVAALEAPS